MLPLYHFERRSMAAPNEQNKQIAKNIRRKFAICICDLRIIQVLQGELTPSRNIILIKLAKTIGIFFGKAQRFITDIKHDIDEQVRSDEIEEIKKSVDDAAKQIDASLKDEVNFIEDEIKDEKIDSTIDEIVNAKKKLDKITPKMPSALSSVVDFGKDIAKK